MLRHLSHAPTGARAPRRLVWALTLGLLLAAITAPAVSAQAATARERGIEIAAIAKARAKAGSFKLAAQMFHEAFKIDATEWSYLFSAGRCEQLGGQLVASEATYTRFLQVAPGGHALRDRAIRELTQVRVALAKKNADAARRSAEAKAALAKHTAAQDAARKAEAARRAAEDRARAARAASDRAARDGAAGDGTARRGAAARGHDGVPAPPRVGGDAPTGAAGGTAAPSGAVDASTAASARARPASGWHGPVGWGGVITGVVAAGVGGALFGIAASDRSALEQRVADGTDAAGRITGISHREAQAEKAAIERRLSRWGVLTAAGAATAAIGAVVLGLQPSAGASVTLAPTRSGLQLGWAARF